jgi:hypothetical protein
MIDVGLLATIVIVLTVPSVFVPAWPASAAPSGVFDLSLGALFVGLAVGRLAALALDDPGSLTSVSDLLIVRSGVEFWPGAAAGLVWIAVRARGDEVAPSRRLAAISSPALVAWACYEATCILREGCPGPLSALGLRPEGLVETAFPIGLVVAAAAVGVAVVGRRWHQRGAPDLEVVVMALFSIAFIRSVASIWLPHIGNGMTRQHKTSIAVAVISAIAFVVVRRRRPGPLIPGGS